MGSYQDVRERAIVDLVWVPGVIGVAAVVLLTEFSVYIIGKILLVGILMLLFTKLGSIGEADAIAFVLITADPYLFSPAAPLLATSAVASVHIAYLFAKKYAGRDIQISLEQFKKEPRWIPKAIVRGGVRTEMPANVNISREEVVAQGKDGDLVDVRYGVPTVAYLGVGYVIFLACLVLFDPSGFLALP